MEWKVDFASAYSSKCQHKSSSAISGDCGAQRTLQIFLPGNDNGHHTRRLKGGVLIRHRAGQIGTALHDLVLILRMAIRYGGLCCRWLLESGYDVCCVDTLGFLCIFIAMEVIEHSRSEKSAWVFFHQADKSEGSTVWPWWRELSRRGSERGK